MDRATLILLDSLQKDCRRSIAELADEAGLSLSSCHRRLRSLEEKGYIEGYVARLAPQALGFDLHAFVEISLNSQSQESMDTFERAIARFDDILECYLMSGGADYMLRIAATSFGDFDRIHRNCLARLPGVSAMRTSFSIRRIKAWQGYPLMHLRD